ncbi:hypothetical protein [Ekhidna sp.]|uniref:hypothetical protein n=1 Tax=Ekhidna sp. TaxID=2608089 RepID=UPI003B5C2DA0
MRDYNYSDDVLAQYGSNVLSYLEEDLPDFTTFDADLGETKKDQLSELVTWALTEGGDDLNVAKLGDLTEKLLQEMDNARKLYKQLRYWVIKSFPERKAVQRQFGIGRFKKMVDSQEAMISFFASLKESVADYRAELEAVNTPTDLLDSIGTQAEALAKAQQDQEKKKGNRTVDTESRVNKLNELYGITRDYNAAAEFVYFDSPAMRDRYRPPGTSEPADADEGIE